MKLTIALLTVIPGLLLAEELTTLQQHKALPCALPTYEFVATEGKENAELAESLRKPAKAHMDLLVAHAHTWVTPLMLAVAGARIGRGVVKKLIWMVTGPLLFLGGGLALDFRNEADLRRQLAIRHEWPPLHPEALSGAAYEIPVPPSLANSPAPRFSIQQPNTPPVQRPVQSVPDITKLRQTANEGIAQAQCDLGVCYEQGAGVPQDKVEAVKWYRKAADQEFSEAQCDLGFCYGQGSGVPKDMVEAVKWFRKAADQRNAAAQCVLGVCYDEGSGVLKDNVMAYLWFNLASASGSKDSAEHRDEISKRMTLQEIAEGQRLSREWKPKNADFDQ